MSERARSLDSTIRPFRRRILLLAMERAACRGLVGAGALAALALIIALFTSWDILPLWLLIIAICGAVAGVVHMARHTPSLLAIAVTIEQRHHLHERISTAIQLQANPTRDEPFRDLVTEDAISRLSLLQPAALFPHRLQRFHTMAVVAWLLVIVLYFVPEIPWLHSPQAREERIAMQNAGEELRKTAQSLEKRPAVKKYQEAWQNIQNMKRLAAKMERGRMPKKEALKELNRLKARAQQQQQALSTPSRQQMQQAAQQLRQSLSQRSNAEKAAAASARQKLAAGIPRAKLTSQERQALEREERTQEAAQALDQGNMSAANAAMQANGQSLDDLEALGEMQDGEEAMEMAQSEMENAQAQMNGERTAEANRSPYQVPQRGEHGECRECHGKGKGSGCKSCGRKGGGEHGAPGYGGPEGEGPGAGGLGDESNERPNATYTRERAKPIVGQGKGRTIIVPGTSRGGAGQVASSSVPYYAVYGDYRKRAERAMNIEQVPPEERRRVKAYFDALDPNGK